MLAGILEGEIARSAGNVAAGIAALERAVALDDELDVDEPEPLPFPARHWLGAALLDAGRAADAERVYQEDLRQHPHNGWALLGLQLALKAQGKPADAIDADLPGELVPLRYLDSLVPLLAGGIEAPLFSEKPVVRRYPPREASDFCEASPNE